MRVSEMKLHLILASILLSIAGVVSYKLIGESSRAIKIAYPSNHTFKFELDGLRSVLEAENIKDRQVVIVSVAGAFRKGKSFLLNLFLRYLTARYEKHDVSDWIGENNNTELRGFLWRGGRMPATSGILMWPDVFTYDYENGDKVAIVLLDTQGTFDSRSSLFESTTVFALSTLLSSVQCYNVMQNIQEDDLQHLQLFIEYARLALEQSDEKPFQHLLFIVRDWQNQIEVDYGWNGQEVIDDVLTEHPTYQTDDMRQLRRQIRSSFAKISAFLMPYPGRIVATGLFTGNMNDVDSDFKKYLQVLGPSLFAPENLIVKEINGQKVRAHELVQYIEKYTKVFDGDTFPQPKTILQATAEINNMILYNKSIHEYLNAMGKYFTIDDAYYNWTEMEKIHMDAKEKAIEQFQSVRKIGSPELVSSFLRRLLQEIEIKLQGFQERNEKIRSMLIEKAKSQNEKIVHEVETTYRQEMLDIATGVSDYDLNNLFNEKKFAALRKFDTLKKGDDLGDEKISYSFRKRLEQNFDNFLPELNRINRTLREERNNRLMREREEKEEYDRRIRTGGGAIAGAGIGAMIGGPVGAGIGFFLGGIFGYKM